MITNIRIDLTTEQLQRLYQVMNPGTRALTKTASRKDVTDFVMARLQAGLKPREQTTFAEVREEAQEPETTRKSFNPDLDNIRRANTALFALTDLKRNCPDPVEKDVDIALYRVSRAREDLCGIYESGL